MHSLITLTLNERQVTCRTTDGTRVLFVVVPTPLTSRLKRRQGLFLISANFTSLFSAAMASS